MDTFACNKASTACSSDSKHAPGYVDIFHPLISTRSERKANAFPPHIWHNFIIYSSTSFFYFSCNLNIYLEGHPFLWTSSMKNPKAVAALLLASASRYKIYERGRRIPCMFWSCLRVNMLWINTKWNIYLPGKSIYSSKDDDVIPFKNYIWKNI